MQSIHEKDRVELMSYFNPAEIDKEFIPYLDRLNKLPYFCSMQCCSGHIRYDGTPKKYRKNCKSKRWGYLQFILSPEAYVKFITVLKEKLTEDIFWLAGCQLPLEERHKSKNVLMTDNGSYELALAWDSPNFEKAINFICENLESLS